MRQGSNHDQSLSVSVNRGQTQSPKASVLPTVIPTFPLHPNHQRQTQGLQRARFARRCSAINYKNQSCRRSIYKRYSHFS